jgi:tetratricopeptide (TPR) repeat protein
MEWQCSCGATLVGSVWAIIDAEWRADLMVAAIEPVTRVRRCPTCNELVETKFPVTIVRMSSVASLIVFRDEASEILEGSELFDILEETRTNLIFQYEAFPPVHLPMEELEFVLKRNIDNDFANLSSLNIPTGGPGSAYEGMLKYLDEIAIERRNRGALVKLGMSRDREVIQDLLDSEPFLLDAQSVARLRENALRQPEAAPMYEADARFLEDIQAGNSPQFERRLADWDRALAVLSVPLDKLDELGASASQRGDWSTSIDTAIEGAELASQRRLHNRQAHFARNGAMAILASPQAEPQKTEQAISLLRQAVECDPDNPVANDLTTLGAMYGRRKIGDRAQNIENAISYSQGALTLLDPAPVSAQRSCHSLRKFKRLRKEVFTWRMPRES